ncbi:MAG: universal stress protein [Saprospiraceae bacterium]
MKKILFPTDFSNVTQKAFVYALDLANQLNASITTLHAYQKPDVGDFVMPASLSTFYEGLDWNEFENYQQAIPALRKIATDCNLGHIQINHAMIEGETIATITNVAGSENYDLIVMGTEGASVLKEIFVGTYAGEVMEEAPCPVIVVPEGAVFDGRVDKIGVTIDFSTDDTKVINNVLVLANALKAKVEVIHVDLSHTGMITKRVQEFKEAYAHHNELTFVEIEGSDVVEVIANYAESNAIDILVMVTHKRNFIQELFSFSHAKKMTYQQKVPVYAIPEQIL